MWAWYGSCSANGFVLEVLGFYLGGSREAVGVFTTDDYTPEVKGKTLSMVESDPRKELIVG